MIAIHMHFFRDLYAKLRASGIRYGHLKMKRGKRAHNARYSVVKYELVMVPQEVT